MLEVGKMFERKYVIRELLGAGGFALVYRAHQPDVDRDVAIKILRRAEDIGTHPATLLARFQREAKMAAELRSEHNIQLFDFGRSSDGFLYMIFEFVDGYPLDELIRKEGAMTPARVIGVLEQLLVGLNEAHELGILHRDVKPANVMIFERLGKKDRAKLIDYGIAKPMGRRSAEDSASITAEGRVVGTPRYMAPEQILMLGELSPATDIYSLGLVAFEMLAGKGLLGDSTHTEVIRRQLSGEVFRVPPSVPAPPGLRRVVDKMLAKSQRDRYQSAEEVIADLRRVDPHEEYETLPPVERLLEDLQSGQYVPVPDTGESVDHTSPITIDSKPMARVSPSEERRIQEGPATVDSRPMAKIREAARAGSGEVSSGGQTDDGLALGPTRDMVPDAPPTQETSREELARKLAGDSFERTGNRSGEQEIPAALVPTAEHGPAPTSAKLAVVLALVGVGAIIASVAVIAVVLSVTDLGERAKDKVNRELDNAAVAAQSDCEDDEHEPNDRSIKGTELPEDGELRARLCPGNVDWYRLGEYPKGTKIEFAAEHLEGEDDFDLELFVDSHHEKSVFTTNRVERLEHATLHDGNVAIRVYFSKDEPGAGRTYRVTRDLSTVDPPAEEGADGDEFAVGRDVPFNPEKDDAIFTFVADPKSGATKTTTRLAEVPVISRAAVKVDAPALEPNAGFVFVTDLEHRAHDGRLVLREVTKRYWEAMIDAGLSGRAVARDFIAGSRDAVGK